MDNIPSAPKTDTFHFRINPDVRSQAEAIYAKCGLTLSQAINVFLQQSLSAGGFPFPVTTENAESLRAADLKRLMRELDAGRASGDLIDERDVYQMLGVEAI